MPEKSLLCVHCGRPVEVNQKYYEVFERMHWLCFHLVFEHPGDPDRACDDPSCPWAQIAIFKEKLRRLGVDPDEVVVQVWHEGWKL